MNNLRYFVLRTMLELKTEEAEAMQPSTGPGDPVTEHFETVKASFLYHLNVAMDKLEDGDYGNCTECLGEIEVDVLDKEFRRIRCIKCQTDHRSESGRHKRVEA
jgi:RNA polymerase-binding transcription factor DksA